jgi:TolB-like protein/tetratricopeptide (TPR) repeat protein
VTNYFHELKRRNVLRVGAAYAVVGWFVIEVVDTIAPRMAMPEWVPGFFIIAVLIGFPVVLLIAWAFEMTPEGLKRTAEVDIKDSITATTGQKINYVIIAALAAVVLFQQFAPSLSVIAPFSTDADDEKPITIAVLPFADLSADGDQEHLGDGVAEEILNVLAGIDGLKVISRTSAFAFKGQPLSIPEIAAALGASHVVEGSVRKQGARVRITGQLIEVADDSHLWSEIYDSDVSDIFRLQDEIANKISAALSMRLGLALPTVERKTPDWDIAAYELFLRARQMVLGRTDMEGAVRLLETALQLEPEFADAWAEKGAALALTAYRQAMAGEAEAYATFDEAWLAASHAAELDPGQPLAPAVQGLVRMNQWRFIESRVLLERALSQQNPSDYASLWLAILQSQTGDAEQALATLEAGLASSPTAPNLLRWRDRVLAYLGRWQEVWDHRESASVIDMLDTQRLRQVAGLKLGEVSVEEFLAWVETALPNMPDEEKALVDVLAPAVARGILPDLGQEYMVDVASFRTSGDLLFASGADMSVRVAALSERILKAPNLNELTDFWTTGLKDFRARPETLQLFREIGLPAYWDLYGWPDMCRRVDINNFACE